MSGTNYTFRKLTTEGNDLGSLLPATQISLPVSAAGDALERTDQLARDPVAIKVARLRFYRFVVNVAFNAAGIKPNRSNPPPRQICPSVFPCTTRGFR